MGFTEKDFDIFKINGLEQRMEAIRSQIRPKLEFIGQSLTPSKVD